MDEIASARCRKVIMNLKNIIVMKIGPHTGMGLQEIIQSKKDEEFIHGLHYWGYSGMLCQPIPTQQFCIKCVNENACPPTLVLIETKSSYKTDKIGKIREYSKDGRTFTHFTLPVQLQGAQYAFVAKNLQVYNEFSLEDYIVVGGKNDGKPLVAHLRYRVGKSFACLSKERNVGYGEHITVLIAEMVPPYAIWLKD